MSINRIQRSRKRGWRKPVNSIFVGRGTIHGNPYKIGDGMTRERAIFLFRKHLEKMAIDHPENFEDMLKPLRGKILICWCRECDACHADVWLEFVNNN